MFTEPFRRHHALIFILAALAVMIISVYSVNMTLSQPVDEAYRQQVEARSIRTNFDQATIDQIDTLRQRQDDSALALPSGKINPFRE